MTDSITPAPAATWLVYIIEATDGRLYTGITTDMARRWQAHSGGKHGAKFFRGRQPARLCYLERDHDRASASRREAAIKKLSRPQKLQLLRDQDPSQLQALVQAGATAGQ
jgi:putative endonuclease